MKTFTLFALCALLSLCLARAQNNTMGIGTSDPNANAVLHLESPTSNQGFIMPRLTSAQRIGMSALLSAADQGLMVYDTDASTLYLWNGSVWKSTTQTINGAEIRFPYADSITSLPDTSTMFRIRYYGTSFGKVEVAQIENTNQSNYGNVLEVSTKGTGSAGNFTVQNYSATGAALSVETNSFNENSAAFEARHTGLGNIAVFSSDSGRVARIDTQGKGYFNGGTQAGGADVAELFAVEGNRHSYTPGDVLVISETSDRTVEKSRTANCTRVVGVYATKPGVLLTERSIDEDTGDLVPMGVVGVIPTKVCTENGPIKRGDLLVTSSLPGHAMKAVPVMVNGVAIYPSGAIIGKALENFDAHGTGMINVMVNVK